MKTLLTSACAGLAGVLLGGSLALAQAPAITLTPDQMYKEYQTDPMFLDKYKGKTIRVTGVVSQAYANPGNNIVWVKTNASAGAAANMVRCLVPEAQKASVVSLRPDVPAQVTGVFTGFSMAFGGILNPCSVEAAAAARPEAPLPDLTVTPDQMVKEFQTDPAFLDKYKGKTIHVTGVVSSAIAGGQNVVWIKTSVSTPASGNMVRCIVPSAQKMSLAPLRPGTPVKATGRFTGFSMTFGGILDPCSVEVTASPPAQPTPAVKGPADPPLGDYAVYQLVWPNFNYQYRFALVDRSHYTVMGKTPGTYTYSSKTKLLTFNSGGLKGFIGLYYTQGRNANGPTICLSHDGRAPNLQGPNTQGYQYAYFRPQGMK